MASVYLAQLTTDAGFQKWVALKTIHEHIAEDQRFLRMFLDEARLAARLDHPNICTVFDFGLADGVHYLAMEYLHGESLDRVARRAAHAKSVVPYAIAARIVSDAARGLHHAHELRMDDGQLANVVHRDVSPQNVFVLYSGLTKVVDFGIARSASRAAEKTRTGELKGKLSYMSPEQIGAPGEVDRRTDVWALGVVLWEVTLGRRLFRRDNPAATVAAITSDVPRPRSIDPHYPEALDTIVMKALARDQDVRYATAAQLARDLDRFVAQSGEPCSPEDVATYVSELFAAEKAERDRMLSADARMSTPVLEVIETSETSLPPLEGELTTSDAAIDLARVKPASPGSPPSEVVAARRDRPRRTYLGILLALSILGVAGAGGVALGLAFIGERDQGVRTVPAPFDAGAIAIALDAGADSGTMEWDAGSDAGPPAIDGGPPAIDAGPRSLTKRPPRTSGGPVDALGFGFVHLVTSPPGLEVYRGEQLLGRTPLRRQLPVGTHSLRVVTPGGGSERVQITVEAGATSLMTLRLAD